MSDEPKTSAVPTGRLSRMLSLGSTGARMALGAAKENLRRRGSKSSEFSSLLSTSNAVLLAKKLSRLRGAAMKVGQMLSLEGDSLLPKEFADALDVLRSSAHQMPAVQVKEVMQGEFGKDWASQYREFDLQPLRSASIGQVHRAMNHDGQETVVKIQYPGVASSIDSDVDNLRSLLSLTSLLPGGLNLDDMAAEIKSELKREVDYSGEAQRMLRYSELLGDHPAILTPRPEMASSGARVITMTRMPGVELLEWAQVAEQQERDRVGRLLFELLFRELFEFGFMQTDPNPANYLYDAESKRLVLLDFGACREVPPHVASLYRKGLWAVAERDSEGVGEFFDLLGVFRSSETELNEEDSSKQREARALMTEMALLASQVAVDGVHDFSSINLVHEIRPMTLQMARYQRLLQPPPPELIFFQRKLAGTYLICRQLGARFNLRELMRQFVSPP